MIGFVEQQEAQGWQGTSWGAFSQTVEKTSRELHGFGCRSGHAIAIMASTSVLWDIIQYAILKIGGIVVGIDAHDTAGNIQSILDAAEITGIISDDPEPLAKVDKSSRRRLSFILKASVHEGCPVFQAVGNDAFCKGENQVAIAWPVIAGDAPATIIFTSGTTGRPKGISYTHRQVLVACQAVTSAYDEVNDASRLVCWLPLSNLFQRMMNYCALAVGARTYYVSNPRNVLDCLPEINPTVFIAVPRFYEKVYEGIQRKIAQATRLQKAVFALALAMNRRFASGRQGAALSGAVRKVTGVLIFDKLKQMLFGGDLRFAVSGSAPMPVWLLEWFEAIDILILEAYGISENIVPIASNTPRHHKFGTVGRPLPPNRVRLSDNGEVEVSGPGVCSHYLSGLRGKARVTADGFLQTGDEGSIDDQGYLSLHGRKGDFFKTSTGIRIAPLSIEKALHQCRFLEHVFVIGDGRKVPIACATIDPDFHADLAFVQRIRQEIKGIISRELQGHQQPAALLLLTREFTVGSGEITANLKLRKKFIIEKYNSDIERSYAILQEGTGENFCLEVSDNSMLAIL